MARILLVDDTETYLYIEQSALAPKHECKTAKNGQEALRALNDSHFDLVLMDMSMPLMSGEEAIRAMRADPKLASVPVIVITAEAAHESVAKSLACADFLHKPFKADELLRRVDRVLAAAGKTQAALLVRAAGVDIAIPLEEVREVVNRPELSPIPGAPRHIIGFLNLRNEPIPVFDLDSRLHSPSPPDPLDQLIVIAQHEGHVLGVCVDDADDVVDIEQSALFPTDPAVADTFGSLSRALVGTWRRNETMVAVLSPLHLVPHIPEGWSPK